MVPMYASPRKNLPMSLRCALSLTLPMGVCVSRQRSDCGASPRVLNRKQKGLRVFHFPNVPNVPVERTPKRGIGSAECDGGFVNDFEDGLCSRDGVVKSGGWADACHIEQEKAQEPAKQGGVRTSVREFSTSSFFHGLGYTAVKV